MEHEPGEHPSRRLKRADPTEGLACAKAADAGISAHTEATWRKVRSGSVHLCVAAA